jgi:hypothetical protein
MNTVQSILDFLANLPTPEGYYKSIWTSEKNFYLLASLADNRPLVLLQATEEPQTIRVVSTFINADIYLDQLVQTLRDVILLDRGSPTIEIDNPPPIVYKGYTINGSSRAFK